MYRMSFRIEASTGLSKEEIAKMKAEAEANAESDKEAREKVDKLNAADSLVFQTEKQIKDYGDKIPAEKKEPIEAAVAELKEAHKMQDMAQVDAATEKLNTAWQAASEEIYKASQEAGAEGGAGQTADAGGDADGGSDQAEDVEFEEVEESDS